MSKEIVAGISYANETAQVAVLEIRKGDIRVLHLEEYKNDKTGDLWFLQNLITRKEKTFKKISKVSVALDSASVVLHSFPIDSSLSQVERNEQVAWELSNLIRGFNGKEYINDVHVLQMHAQDHVADSFVVAAKRTDVFKIQHALADRKFELHIVDTNHFGGQYALLVNYPEVKMKTVALASVGEHRIDIGTLNHGRLTSYCYSKHSIEDEAVAFLSGFISKLPATDLFVFGTGIDSSLMRKLQTECSFVVTKLNPFRRLSVASSVRDFSALAGKEHHFGACVGVALRKE